MTNTKEKLGKEERVQIKTRQPGPVSPSGFSQLRRHADLDSVDTIAEILSLPTESRVQAEGSTQSTGSTQSAGITSSEGNSHSTGNTLLTGITPASGNSHSTGNTHSTGKTSQTGTTRTSGSAHRARSSSRQARPVTSAPVSPERDFQKVPNSVTREMAARLFRGKSKQLYDYLWSQSRGAIVPARTVRRSRPQLLRGAGFGSMGTVERCIDFLIDVGLLKMRTIIGESEGNEYEIFTPEEAAPALLGLSSSTGNTHSAGNTGSTLFQVIPVLPEIGNTGSTSSSIPSSVSEESKTSFKTSKEKNDDEAFAGLLRRLRQASREVTGRDTSLAEAERWNDVAEILVTELQLAASRTTVSSAPAFLAEHLRRRLRKADARQIEREVSEATAGVSAAPAPSKPELTADALQEQANLMTGLLRDGNTIQELEEQFAANFRASQWHQIRSIALAQHGFSKPRAGSGGQDDVLEIGDAPADT